MAVRRGDSVNSATFGALADKRYQGKVSAASLASGGQTTIGDKLTPDRAVMRVVNKFNELAAHRKRTATTSTTTASSHIQTSKN
jgi:hypothetical protein